MRRAIILFFAFTFLFLGTEVVRGWGFFAHQRINRLAVFTLPPEMVGFYKAHIVFVTEHAVDPDSRRYAVKGEAPRHYIDLDVYGDSAIYKMPHKWEDAVAQYGEDTLQMFGIVPWHIEKMRKRLIWAFKNRNPYKILKTSAEIGHYIADSNVPLHTTENYNGQKTNQKGIHGFWESRLPELFAHDYDFLVGKASYVEDPIERAWANVKVAHLAMDSVLFLERKLNGKTSQDKKYSFEERNRQTVKVYSKEYSKKYHNMMRGMVERQMRASIKMTADFWYSCWVDAGQPELDGLIDFEFDEEILKQMKEEQEYWKKRTVKSREHN